jgi:hypothetical protein
MELALLDIQIQACLAQRKENLLNVVLVFLLSLAIDEDVVEVDCAKEV